MKQENQKVLLTRELVDNAAIELEKIKDRKEITVFELCKKAGISRTTFYSHYQSVNDVFKEAYSKMRTEIENRLKMLDKNTRMRRYYLDYLSYIKDQSPLLGSLIRTNPFANDDVGDLKEVIIQHIMSTIREEMSESEKRMMANFIFGGTLSCLINWHEHPDSYSITEVTDLLMKYTYQSMGGKSHE